MREKNANLNGERNLAKGHSQRTRLANSAKIAKMHSIQTTALTRRSSRVRRTLHDHTRHRGQSAARWGPTGFAKAIVGSDRFLICETTPAGFKLLSHWVAIVGGGGKSNR